jgi:Bacterial protein of unknown function (DUF937)
MALYEILADAQQGEAMSGLGREFGLTPQQTQAAVAALLPPISMGLKQSKATQVTLLVSLVLAIFAALVHWVPLAVPHLHTGFTVLMLGYLVLLAGNVFRGL